MESLFHLCIATNQNTTSWCFSVSPKIFCCSSPVVFHNNVHFPSSCLLGDYPLTAGMGSICQPCNLLRYDVLKNKGCCFFVFLFFKNAKLQPKPCHLFVFWRLTRCILRSRRLTMPPPPPPVFERGSNKKSMGATSCSGLRFEVFYLEMNGRPLPYERKTRENFIEG